MASLSTFYGGRVDEFRLEGDEDGWNLIVETESGTVRFNVHGIASSGEFDELLEQCKVELAAWRIEGRMAARQHEADLARQAADEHHDSLVGDS